MTTRRDTEMRCHPGLQVNSLLLREPPTFKMLWFFCFIPEITQPQPPNQWGMWMEKLKRRPLNLFKVQRTLSLHRFKEHQILNFHSPWTMQHSLPFNWVNTHLVLPVVSEGNSHNSLKSNRLSVQVYLFLLTVYSIGFFCSTLTYLEGS